MQSCLQPALLSLLMAALVTAVSAEVQTIPAHVVLDNDGWHKAVTFRCQPWPSRTDDKCYPGNVDGAQCFRRIVDGVLSEDDAESIVSTAQDHKASAILFDIQEHHPGVLSRLKQLVAEEAGIDTSSLVLSHARVESGTPASTGFRECRLHTEYATSRHYALSALVFLSDMDHEDAGGELAFVDESGYTHAWQSATRQGRTDHLKRAVLVEPKIGRAVVFSGGYENTNCRLPLASGSRHTLQLWFTCQ